LYCPTHRLCRRGAAVKNLSHSASFHFLDKVAPSKPGIKHLAPDRERRRNGHLSPLSPTSVTDRNAAVHVP
jgi:hypothetical protein